MIEKNQQSTCGSIATQKKHRTAFTLIELLVVIAIISLLAALLFPVFARARDKARQAACTSNLKQISLALKQYAQDYDGSYPVGTVAEGVMGGSGLRAPSDPQSLPAVLNPYIKNFQIFVCPNGRDELREIGNTYQYNINKVLANPDVREGTDADYLVLWDVYSYKTVTAVGVTGLPTIANPPYCAHTDGKRYNHLYLDGHVKTIIHKPCNK